MADFRLLTYAANGSPRAGLLVQDNVLDLQAALGAYGQGSAAGFLGDSVLSVLQAWDTARPVLNVIASEFGKGGPGVSAQPLSQARLLPPILYPGAIFCAVGNYSRHKREMSGNPPPDKAHNRPYFFQKTSVHSVIGPEDAIHLPAESAQIDWESEIAVVIGRKAHKVSQAEAMSCVAGYTIMNDLSNRVYSARKDQQQYGHDWFGEKSFDTSAPMGPWITPADCIPDPNDLTIQLWLNDELMQDGSSEDMHFTIPEQIEYLSEQLTLRPGDIISTGTCAGVGRPRGIYLKPGDEVTIKISGLGTLHNRVIRDPADV
jgi:2-keto-4-pentenoate hydratase/2-oxohepta-3-ene-1,7-dioic acid hydratase in catechol pathway